MADISMCKDDKCPSKELCYRFTATPSRFYQSYGASNREDDAQNCDMFWDNGVCKYCKQSKGIHKMSCPKMKIQVDISSEAKERARNYMRLKDGYVDKYEGNSNPLLMDEIGQFPFIKNK
jgi:hypothetical protein